MKNSIKHAVILTLLSSTALSSQSQIPYNNTYDQNRSHKKVETGNIKESKASYHAPAKHSKLSAQFEVKEVKLLFEALENQDAINMICAEYVGKYIDNQMVAEMEAKIMQQLIKQDYLVPHVKIVDKKGVLHISAKVAKIDRVIILGEGENNKMMQQYADKITSQNIAKVKYTQKYIALMNKIPGYDVQYKLGETPDGQVELVIATEKTKAEAFAGVDNYGVNDLGKMQTNGSVQVYSPFGKPDSLLVHASTTNHPNRLYDVGLGYSRILNAEGTSGHLFASHSISNSTKDNAVAAEDNKSNAIRASLTHYLYLTAHQSLDGEFGVNYRNSTNYTVDGITNSSRTNLKANYYTSDVGLKYTFKDKAHGRNILHLTYLQGINGDFKNYEDGGVLDNTNKTDEHFGLIKFHFYRDQPLPRNFSVFTHLTANYSGDNLPSSEMLTLGGRDFGRGYAFGTLDGTRMLGAAMEFRYHHKIETNKFLEELQPYLFHDRGYVGKQYGDTDITHLSSLGGGLRFKFIKDIDLGFEAAAPGKKHYRVDGENKEAKTKYGVYLNKLFKF